MRSFGHSAIVSDPAPARLRRGGGGSSTSATPADVQALSLPDRIELSNVQDSTGRGARAGLPCAAHTITAGTDYANQVKNSWVDDTDALDLINTVLGIVNQTRLCQLRQPGRLQSPGAQPG